MLRRRPSSTRTDTLCPARRSSDLQVVTGVVALVVVIALFVLVYRTRWGHALQAVAEDREVAALVGISPDRVNAQAWMLGRSEEHTSELQSLMRISSAVFCSKKKHCYTHIIHY